MNEMVKFVTEPEVFLVTRPQVDREAVARFLSGAGFPRRFAHDHPHDAEQAIATGSRTCYMSFDSGRPPDDHIAHLIEVGHGSVLEHAAFGVLVGGIDRSCSHQVVRHRHLSPSQLSQRYVDQSEARFVVPPALLTDGPGGRRVPWENEVFTGWLERRRADLEGYFRLLSQLEANGVHGKAAREAARSELPECVETRLLLTGNLRAWRNWFERRCSGGADAQIRRLACRALDVIRPHAPAVFADYERHPLGDGTFEVQTDHGRV